MNLKNKPKRRLHSIDKKKQIFRIGCALWSLHQRGTCTHKHVYPLKLYDVVQPSLHLLPRPSCPALGQTNRCLPSASLQVTVNLVGFGICSCIPTGQHTCVYTCSVCLSHRTVCGHISKVLFWPLEDALKQICVWRCAFWPNQQPACACDSNPNKNDAISVCAINCVLFCSLHGIFIADPCLPFKVMREAACIIYREESCFYLHGVLAFRFSKHLTLRLFPQSFKSKNSVDCDATQKGGDVTQPCP